MTARPSIAVVGSSLTGPTAALLLKRAGFTNLTVYESFSENVPLAGGVIGLDHVSLGIMDDLGIPQDEFVPFNTTRVSSIRIASRAESGRVEYLYPGRNTTWTDLHRSLASRLVREIEYSRKVVGVDGDDSGRARLRFQDGSDAPADVVIFADGRGSYGRRVIAPTQHVRYGGFVAWRGQTVCTPEEIREYLRYELTDGEHFDVFPLALGGGRVGVDWTFFTPVTEVDYVRLFGKDPTKLMYVQKPGDQAVEHMTCQAQELPGLLSDLVQRRNHLTALPLLDIDKPRHNHKRIGESIAVLLGDALAPVYPQTGRGANNGINQAAGFVSLLRQVFNYDADVDSALKGWQDRYVLPQVHKSLDDGPRILWGNRLSL